MPIPRHSSLPEYPIRAAASQAALPISLYGQYSRAAHPPQVRSITLNAAHHGPYFPAAVPSLGLEVALCTRQSWGLARCVHPGLRQADVGVRAPCAGSYLVPGGSPSLQGYSSFSLQDCSPGWLWKSISQHQVNPEHCLPVNSHHAGAQPPCTMQTAFLC